MHASRVFFRVRRFDCRSALDSSLRRTRFNTSQGGLFVGLYSSGPATVIRNASGSACTAAAAAINATRATDLGAGSRESHESYFEPAARARDVTGPAKPLHVSVWPLWRAAH